MAALRRVALLVILGSAGVVAPAAYAEDDPAAPMFQPSTVVEIGLTLPQASIDALRVEPEEYQPATFSMKLGDDAYGPLEIGARLKGHGSFRPLEKKAALKLKFNEFVSGQKLLGLKRLTLNNMVQDESMIHEVLTYETFRAAGIDAPHTGYAYLRINDLDYGLYLNLETVDDVAVEKWFESTQHLYEGERGADVVKGRTGLFEVDEGDEEDLSDLEALVAAVADESADFSDRVAGIVDLEQMTLMWAVERYVGHHDGYSNRNNYYLHSDAAGVFRMLPWGTDRTLDERMRFDGGPGGRMFNLCLDDPSCAATYSEAVAAVRTAVARLDLDGLAETTAAALEPWQELDPRRAYSLERIAAAVSATRAFLAARPADVDAWFARAPRTRIRSAPDGTNAIDGRRFGFKYKFAADVPHPHFECRLDDAPFVPCDSPERIRVGRGRHRLLVRATSVAGTVDATPAVDRFRVVGD